ncbi:MAG: Maf family protein [Woeseiaceae bacterium]|nr:Maf family protein [Woeseiaceae bacterium]
MDSTSGLLLASTSPRRREILSALRLEFSVCAVDVDETPAAGESAEAMVLRLASAKVEAADRGPAALVLGADTAVVADDQILGKPLDEADCLAMLDLLSDRVHQVVTGVALRTSVGTATAVSTTDVYFREIRRDEALAYWQSGEPCDKAGAYAIQGLGGAFVTRIDGSYSGVVGLPVFETLQLLHEAGLTVLKNEKP